MLYIPSFWWHQVYSDEPSIAVNFWWSIDWRQRLQHANQYLRLVVPHWMNTVRRRFAG